MPEILMSNVNKNFNKLKIPSITNLNLNIGSATKAYTQTSFTNNTTISNPKLLTTATNPSLNPNNQTFHTATLSNEGTMITQPHQCPNCFKV